MGNEKTPTYIQKFITEMEGKINYYEKINYFLLQQMNL